MIELIIACAPNVAPQTIEEIIAVESSGDPLALNVNGLPPSQQPRPTTTREAAAYVRQHVAAGRTVDVGLMQVNSANFTWLGYSLDGIEALFSPCANIAAGATVLSEAYTRAVARYGEGQQALAAALSAYNTGSFDRGFENGYVARFYGHGNPIPEAAASAPSLVRWEPPADYFPTEETTTMEDEPIDTTPTADALAADALREKEKALRTPGAVLSLSPEEADRLGAFAEDAMAEEDAYESASDPEVAP